MKYALIGCGRIAPNHIAAARENNLEICAVCDIDRGNAERLLQKFGDEKFKPEIYTDYKQMLERERPQLVGICTPSGSHAKITVDCIEYGCNVIVEKPMALSLEDADNMIAAADKKGVVLCACHQKRFNKSIQKIRSAIEKGSFGKLLHASASTRWKRSEKYYTQAAWRGTWEQDGGALMNQCIHNIDLLRWMMGDEIIEVTAYCDNLCHDYIEAEDLGLAMVKFKNGGYGIIEGTVNMCGSDFEETLSIFGERGRVRAAGIAVNSIDEWKFEDEDENIDAIMPNFCENPQNVYGSGHTRLYADVINAINNGTKPYVDGAAGRRALELVLGIYKSAAEGRSVKFPLESCSTMDFKK